MKDVLASDIGRTGLDRPNSQFTSTALVCLNFKVPLRVRQQFKICAARHNLTMTQLLLRLLEENLTLEAQGQSTRTHK
jgi:hypothetical protein